MHMYCLQAMYLPWVLFAFNLIIGSGWVILMFTNLQSHTVDVVMKQFQAEHPETTLEYDLLKQGK